MPLILKNMKKIKISLYLIVAFGTIIIYSCKKDRIEKTPAADYDAANTNNYLNSKQEPEQIFTITDTSLGPIVGKHGTITPWVSKSCLVKVSTGDTIEFPYTVKMVELYTPKSMIYAQMPTVASGTILSTDGEIRLRAFKGTEELKLASTSCSVPVFMPQANPQSNMLVYYGAPASYYWFTGSPVFPITPFSPTTNPSNGYQGSIYNLGWINCGVLAGSNSNSSLSFTSTTDVLTNVAIFIYMPATKTVMQVYNLNSTSIPNGTAVKIICIGENASGGLFAYTQNLTVTSTQAINITMASITDVALTAILDGL